MISIVMVLMETINGVYVMDSIGGMLNSIGKITKTLQKVIL